MLDTQVEVAKGRTVETKNGTKHVHQLTIKTEEGYQCFEYWSDSQLKAGIYNANFIPRAYNNRLGLHVTKLDPK